MMKSVSNNKKKSGRRFESPLVANAAVVSTETRQNRNTDHSKAEFSVPSRYENSRRDKKKNIRNHRKRRKRTAQDDEEEAEERRLTAMIFQGVDSPLESTSAKNNVEDGSSSYLVQEYDGGDNPQSRGDLFEIDYAGSDFPLNEKLSDEDDSRKPRLDDDRAEVEQGSQDNPNGDGSLESRDTKKSKNEIPLWQDDDDVALTVDLMQTSRLRKLRKTRGEDVSTMNGMDLGDRLRERFQTTTMATARTDWAQLDKLPNRQHGSDDQDEEEMLLASSSAPLLASPGPSGRLPRQIIEVVRCPDANLKDPSQAVVQAVQFRASSNSDRPLMFTAGLDKTLRFFHVGADKSQKIHGIFFPQLPIYSASFLGDTNYVVASGRRPFFYLYDMVAGKMDRVPRIMGREERSLEKFTTSPDGKTIAFLGNDGYIILVDVSSRQWIADLKMNGSVRAVTFTSDGEQLLASGSDGDVYRWDMRSMRCIERFANEDGTITSSLAASDRFLAVGAESGVVNIYDDFASLPSSTVPCRKPIKSILNLHTSCDMAKFNHDGQILAVSTRRDNHSALKLVHVPSQSVFSNWPTSKTPLSYVWSVDFSPQSKFMAVGNDKGKVLLYKLLHYHQ